MTFRYLKDMVHSIMLGDKKIPEDNKIIIPLVDLALFETAKIADSLALSVNSSFGHNIVRQLDSGEFIRRAELPSSDNDIIDIDDDLCMAVAHHIASKIAKEKAGIYFKNWGDMCRAYNKKLYNMLDYSKKNNMPDLF